MKERYKGILRFMPLILGLAGAVLGFIYYYYIGCANGSCPIKSSPYLMTLYGLLIGALTGELFRPSKKKRSDKE